MIVTRSHQDWLSAPEAMDEANGSVACCEAALPTLGQI